MEQKKVSLKDAELLVISKGYTIKKDEYQGMYVKQDKKTKIKWKMKIF